METAPNADDNAPRSPSTTQKHTRRQSSKDTILPYSSKIGNQQHVRPMLPSIPSKTKLPPCLPVGGCNAHSIARQVHLIQEQNVVVVVVVARLDNTTIAPLNLLSLHNSINCIIVYLHLFCNIISAYFGHIESTDLYTTFNTRIDPSTVNLHSTIIPPFFPRILPSIPTAVSPWAIPFACQELRWTLWFAPGNGNIWGILSTNHITPPASSHKVILEDIRSNLHVYLDLSIISARLILQTRPLTDPMRTRVLPQAAGAQLPSLCASWANVKSKWANLRLQLVPFIHISVSQFYVVLTPLSIRPNDSNRARHNIYILDSLDYSWFRYWILPTFVSCNHVVNLLYRFSDVTAPFPTVPCSKATLQRLSRLQLFSFLPLPGLLRTAWTGPLQSVPHMICAYLCLLLLLAQPLCLFPLFSLFLVLPSGQDWSSVNAHLCELPNSGLVDFVFQKKHLQIFPKPVAIKIFLSQSICFI